MKTRAWIVIALVTVATLESVSQTNRYDEYFRSYSKRFFGVGFDWKVFKAQALTESSLSPDARSWVGAVGIMQLLPSTFREIQSENSDFQSIDDPRWNIAAGIKYDRKLWNSWRDISANGERLNFVFGSYNAGRSTIIRAQDQARIDSLDHQIWGSIELVAPKIGKWRSSETVQYIRRIEQHRAKLTR